MRVKTRAATPEQLDCLAAPAESENADQRELRQIICEEVNRLPVNYRAAVVACFFEGKTHEEAAKQLGWPRGTVAGRLARARELLRRRLLRRGVTLTMSALLTALAAGTAQAALTGLVDSVIHTARLVAAGQSVAAAVSPQVATLAEGVLQTMYWTKAKVAVIVMFLASLGGAGVSLLATQEQKPPPVLRKTTMLPPRPEPSPILEMTRADAPPASDRDEEDEPAEDLTPPVDNPQPADATKLAHDMARSRLNLKKLALAIHNYADVHQGLLPLAATVGKDGKALLSWRVELLPYLGENELYNQFKRDEPWDSPHNRQLLSKMPAVFAPPGAKTQRTYSTYYQVFVSAGPSSGGVAAGSGGAGMMMPGMGGGMPGGAGMPGAGAPGMGPPGGGAGAPAGPAAGGPGGAAAGGGKRGGPMMAKPGMPMMMPGAGGPQGGAAGAPGGESATAVFVKGEAQRFPAHIIDGTSNTILIVEAGNPVPWTKPEDLRYAEDEPLPELGGLFPNVFHAAFADGSVHTLTKNYNKKHLRLAITANDGMVMDMSKIEAHSGRRIGKTGDRVSVETWQRKNEELRKELEVARQQMRVLKEEQEVERELAGEDPRVRQLKEEHTRMQAELKKLRDAIDAMKKDMRQPRKVRVDEEEEERPQKK